MPQVKKIARQYLTALTDSNWEKLASHGEIVLDLFSKPGAKSLVRTGEHEMKILQDQHPIASRLAEAIAHTDCLGLAGMERSDCSQSIIRSLRTHHKVEIDKSVHVSSWLFSYMPELAGKLTSGRRVLWITSDAERIVKNLENPAFRDFYGLHDIAKNDWINAAEPMDSSVYPKHVSVEQAFEDIQHQLSEKDFDLALVGVGVTGRLVCHHIKTVLGKSAVDIGICMSYLKGARDHPTLRPHDANSTEIHFLVWDPAANRPDSSDSTGSQANNSPMPVAHDGSPTAATMCMLADRWPHSLRTVLSLKGQVSTLYLCLNNFQEVPSELEQDWIKVLHIGENLGDAARFYLLKNLGLPNAHLISCDDDIEFPKTYVQDFLNAHQKYPDALLTHHGEIYSDLIEHHISLPVYHDGVVRYTKREEVKRFMRFRQANHQARYFDIPGSGVSFIPRSIFDRFEFTHLVYWNMADTHLACNCKKLGVRIIGLPRPAGYFRYISPSGQIINRSIGADHKEKIEKIYASYGLVRKESTPLA